MGLCDPKSEGLRNGQRHFEVVTEERYIPRMAVICAFLSALSTPIAALLKLAIEPAIKRFRALRLMLIARQKFRKL